MAMMFLLAPLSAARLSVAEVLMNERLLLMSAQVFHWASIAPLAYLVMAWAGGRFNPWPYRLMAWGFGVSFISNLVSDLLPDHLSWAQSHFYPALQLSLFALALGAVEVPLVMLILMVVLLAYFPLSAPSAVLKVAGSTAVFAVLPYSEFAAVLLVYCGVGCFLWINMTGSIPDPPARTPEFMAWYYVFHTTLLVGIGMFVRQTIRLHREAS